MQFENIQIIIVGQGYVGLALALEFGKKYTTIGYDINTSRIEELSKQQDSLNEFSKSDFQSANFLSFENKLINPNPTHQTFYIVTVPTPIDINKKPDLTILENACEEVATKLNKNDFVIFESTVFPGCTEEICIPILEKTSGLVLNTDFFVGYSPERINPGDKIHTLTSIVKITSGSNAEASKIVDKLYASIVHAGTYNVENIKIAESAKIIENCQRDVNIAFMNEMAQIFDHLDINLNKILEAAQTKWNFLNFKPGLVGGSCIGVDPYYLIQKSESKNYTPKLLKEARNVNENFGLEIVNKCIIDLNKNKIQFSKAKCLILGFAFKPNCSNFQNTKVVDLHKKLADFGIYVDIYDPLINIQLARKLFSTLRFCDTITEKYDIIIQVIPHQEILNTDLKVFVSKHGKIYNIIY